MRPRFMNRGSSERAQIGCVRRLGFNEAPIHESGKSGRFALIFWQPESASMRPRFMNRGSTGIRRIADWAQTLQ